MGHLHYSTESDPYTNPPDHQAFPSGKCANETKVLRGWERQKFNIIHTHALTYDKQALVV